MKINILNTDKLYREMMALPDKERAGFFDEMFLEPFAPMLRQTGMPRNAEALACLAITGSDRTANDMLNQLVTAKAWEEAKLALTNAAENLQNAGILVPEEITFGIFLGDPEKLAQSEGYTGAGSTPGYIIIMIAPNEKNLPKLNSCIAHEFHHNVLFYNSNWNFMNITLSQYLAVEGMAESFASEIYGEEAVGPWVTSVVNEDLERSRKIIGKNMDVSGFMKVRNYIFGQNPMIPGSEALGIHYCGGYAVGYHAIQEYMHKTGRAIAQTTKAFINGEDVVKQSGYFTD